MVCKACKKYKMRFVGWKDGKLIPTAPSGIKQGTIQKNFVEFANLPYWELDEDVPDLVIPKVEHKDSVFEEEIYVPSEDETEPDHSKLTVVMLKEEIKSLGGVVKSTWKKADLIEEYARVLKESLSPP